ncbi:MAG: prohibitin family protein [Kiritimatiellae bacterium]|nr:prohibitin family protein [Kiritimatiellia bacterium]
MKKTKRISIFRRSIPHFIVTSLIILLIFLFFAPSIFIFVKPGEAAVLWRRFFGGTIVDHVYGEGFHIIPPWDKMYIYNVRIQQIKPELKVLTKNGLTIHLKLSIRYSPEYELLGVLHQKVGPGYVKAIVIPEIENILRTTIGNYTADELYTTKRAILSKIINKALEQVIQRYIIIDDVIIRKVILPEYITTAIEVKLKEEQKAKAYVFRIMRAKQEAERKKVAANGIKRYNDIVNSSLTDLILQWKGIEATRQLAASTNSKMVVIGNGPEGMPIILGAGNR